MENRGRVLSVDFSNAVGRTVKASPLTAIDYGQILEIHGLPLPPSFECHFSKNGATAYKSIGTTANGIGTVPFVDEQTQSGGIITAYIYLHETADDGETEYRIIIPVESRPGVTPAEPTPVEQDVIAQAISALNNAVQVTGDNVVITETNAQASAEYAQNAYEYADDASRSASSAHESETNAEQARLETVSARDRAIEAKDTAHSEAQYAKSYSESAHTDAQSASASATSAQSSATSAQQSASLAQQYASTATAKASEAMQSAQIATQKATESAQSAQNAQQSATQANTSATSASASATSATASEASASASATSAQESAESAQASADRAEQEADRWYEFLPVDTASGSLVHITDGAKDVPVKALSVSLEPIQSGSGDPSPDNVRPITGHTQVVVNRDDGNGGNLQSITIPLGDTVYGGTLDVVNGVLTVDRAMVDLGTLTWRYNGTEYSYGYFYATPSPQKARNFNFISSVYPNLGHARGGFGEQDKQIGVYNTNASGYVQIAIRDDSYTDATAFKTAMSGMQLCYELATPIEIPLTANQMTTLLGINNVWSDSGDVSVDYRADVQLYIQKMIANAMNA